MTLINLIETILEKGTDTTLGGLTGSEDFQDRLVDRQHLFALLAGSDSDIAVALRAGHIEMGELLQNMPEYLALQQASQGDDPDPFVYELLEEVGEALVATATSCLPAPILQVARHIGDLSADEQIRWIGLVYDGFQYAHDDASKRAKKNKSGKNVIWTMESDALGEIDVTQEDIDDIVEHYTQAGMIVCAELVSKLVQWVSEDLSDDPPEFFNDAANLVIDYFEGRSAQALPWLRDVTELDYPIERVLPASYGVFGQSSTVPTCLGMSIMLVAFARLTGLNTMLVSPIEASDDLHKEYKGVDATAKQEHLDVLGFECKEYRQKLHTAIQNSVHYGSRVYDFHYSVAIQVCDGRWVHLDPYMRHIGLFDDDWELQRIYDTLDKYQLVLPGLALQSSDGGSLEHRLIDFVEECKRAIAKAERVMQAIDEKPYPSSCVEQHHDMGYFWIEFDDTDELVWMSDLLTALDDAVELSTNYLGQFGVDIKPRDVLSLTEFFFEDILLGNPKIDVDDVDRYIERLLSYSDLFLLDDDFRQARIVDLILGFLRIAIDRWNAQMNEIEHTLLDPVMQFSLPEYNIALAVVSHVRCWTDNDVSGRVLLKLSSSQFYWHEAVDLSEGYEQSDAEHHEVLSAESLLENLPHLHRACANKLRYISQMRETPNRGEE